MADDNPYLSAGDSQSTDNPYLKAAQQPVTQDNPYLSAGSTTSQGRGYPALGGVTPNAPGTPSGAQGTTGWYDMLSGAAKAVYGQAGPAMKGFATEAPKGVEAVPEADQNSPFARLGTYLAKQSPDYLSDKIGAGIKATQNAVEGVSKFLLSQPSGAMGAPKSVTEGAGKLAKDIGAYLFEGGSVTDVGGAAEHATPREAVRIPERAATGAGAFGDFFSQRGASHLDFNDENPAFSQRLQRIVQDAEKATGDKVRFTSLARSRAQQEKLYYDYTHGINHQGLAAPPGRSLHERGLAADLADGPALDWIRAHASEYGLAHLGMNDKGHIQMANADSVPPMIRERALGAEASNPSEAPAPNRQWFNEQDDKFFQLRQRHQKDEAEFIEAVNNIPDEFKTPDMQERFYKYMEDPNSTELSPSEQAFYKTTIEPLKREERDLYEELKKTNLDVSDYNPTYAHRIVKGRAPVFDALAGERGASFNPISGYKSFTAPSLKSRKFYVLEDAQGNRKVVALSDGRLTELNNGLDTPLRPDKPGTGEESLKGVGDTVGINGKQYTLKNAKTSEIEAKTGTRYYKNALANTIDNLIKLRAAARAQYLFNDLKESPQFLTLARRFGGNQPIPEGWRSVQMPTFRGWALEPKFADMVDDFYGGTKSALGDKLTKINQIAVRSLFFTPTPHLLNTFAMWSVARGWDMATPMGIRSFLVDGTKAFKAVFTMNKEYREMLDHGAGLVYSGVKNQDFYRQMMNRLGENIKRDPASWDPIARIMGVGPSDLIKIIYDGSSKILWGGSDFFLMQRVYELKRKGMSTHDAIVEAEKYIPNYRIPSQVLGSRRFALLLKDPSLTEFSRYHYGVWKSLAHLANDLAGPKATVAKRFDTIGKIAVGGGLLFGLWPVISYGIQKLSGEKDLEFSPKGSTKIPADLLAWYNGDKQFIDVVSDSLIMAPVLKEGLEQFFNANFFQAGHNMPGSSIIDKVDQQQGVAHQALIRGQHALGTLNSPYGMLEQAGRPKGSMEKEALSALLGTRKKPKKYVPGSKDYKSHARRPKGMLEKGLDELK